MMISGVVYSLGDWIAQCYEGKPLFEFDCARMFRSGLVGFTLHGSLSHYYYQFCESLFLFPRSFFLPKTGGWFLPKQPLIKLFGQLSRIVPILRFWGSCVLNLHSVFLASRGQHFCLC